jgi:uncharacterized C2H2 Zn-finger protein
LYLNCPWCNQLVQLPKSQIKCCIYRHGVHKKSGRQIGSHAKKEYVEKLLKNDKIYGCGMPFKFNKQTQQLEMCGWI